MTDKKTDDEILLRVNGLKRHFKTNGKIFKAVDGVSFFIKKGESFGLVGESGCGKTTTGRCIVGIGEITDGEICFHGKRIGAGTRFMRALDKKTRWQVRAELRENAKVLQKIQMIFQDPIESLDPRMTVREIVAEGLVCLGEKDKKKIAEKVDETLKTVGLSPSLAGRFPHEFSGGQRQRVGIARAIVTEPELVVADEPVSALDVSVQAQVVNLLDDLKTQFGLTVLFIAHNLSVVKYFSDRIGVMYRGKLVEIAPSDALFEDPLHPYTKALLSAIPLPDPRYEKSRIRTAYEPSEAFERGELKEIAPDRFVRCDEATERALRERLFKESAGKKR